MKLVRHPKATVNQYAPLNADPALKQSSKGWTSPVRATQTLSALQSKSLHQADLSRQHEQVYLELSDSAGWWTSPVTSQMI